MSIADEIREIVRAEVRAAIAELLVPTKSESVIEFERVPAFAKRIGVGERSAWNLVAKGLPTVGSARSRRVDVVRALEWLRNERATVDDAIERAARRAAGRAARKV